MRNKAKYILLVLLCSFMLWMDSAYASNYMANTNAKAINDYLKNTMGLNPAACAAVLANIRAESSFDPHNSYTESGGFISYGICQWNRGRLDNLKSYCANNGYDYTTLTGQLHFFDYEIKTSYYRERVYNNLISTPNTEQGAYDAAVNFCVKFEVPANQDVVGPQRGSVARQIYNELDPNPVPATNFRFLDVTYPATFKIDTTNGWWLEGGTLESNYTLTSLKSEILNANGGAVSSYTHSISGYRYTIKAIDNGASENGVKFSKIGTPGSYTWRLTATDSGGRTLVLDMPINAVSSGSTVKASASIEYKEAHLDLNGLLDGGNSGNITGYGTADVYINGSLVADDVDDYFVAWPSGTRYEIKDIKTKAGRTYNGSTGSLSGNIGSTTTTVVLSFSTIKVTGVTLNATELTLEPDKTAALTATILPSDALDQAVEWTSSDTSVATITASSTDPRQVTVTAGQEGTAIITCTTHDGSKTAACTVTVAVPTVPVAEITLSRTELTLVKGENATLTATVSPANATNKGVTWVSNNPSAATVSGGVVKAIGKGKAVIICLAADGSDVTGSCTVTVIEEAVSEFKLPSGLKEIGEEAFAGIDARRIVVPNGVKTIGKRAFAGCAKLEQITIPATTTAIAADAFANVPSGFTIHGSLNSYAQTYAAGNGIRFVADDACTITFDATGGTGSITSRMIRKGEAIGTLPTASKANNALEGWYTSVSDGTKVTSSTVFTEDTTLYAHWRQTTCTVTFNANGGTCSTSARVVNQGEAIGTLPTATKDYWNFGGWYTAASGGTKVETTTVFTADTTLYAQWPSQKGFGAWSDWSTTAATGNGNREVQTEVRQVQTGTKTIYHYERYLYWYPDKGYYQASYGSNWATSQGYSGSWQYATTETRWAVDHTTDGRNVYVGEVRDGNKYWYNESTTTEPVYSNVTYYRYRDRIK